jgi:hypothetical protein
MDFDPDKPQKHKDVVIEDLRHRRDVDDMDEPEPEAAAEPEPQHEVLPIAPIGHKQEAAEEALEELPVAATGAEGALENNSAGLQSGEDSSPEELLHPEGEHPYSEDEIRAMEREQLRQIISLGLVNYLKYQLTMVLNFALLSLGSAPDPATGLVSKDLPQAKLAIDVLEFLVARLQGEMSVAERQQMAQLVSDLKYSFMQAAADGAPAAAPTQGEA